MGSMAAAVQTKGLWNSQKTFYKTFLTTCCPRLYRVKMQSEPMQVFRQLRVQRTVRHLWRRCPDCRHRRISGAAPRAQPLHHFPVLLVRNIEGKGLSYQRQEDGPLCPRRCNDEINGLLQLHDLSQKCSFRPYRLQRQWIFLFPSTDRDCTRSLTHY